MTVRPPRVAGGFLGASLAVALIVLALPQGGRGGVPLPASLDVAVQTGSAIAATPAAPDAVLQTTDLRPGGAPATAGFELVNEGGRPATVGLRALPSSRDLDDLVRVEIEANGETLADATLAELRAGTLRSVVLGAAESRSLRVSVSIPDGAKSGFEGKHVAVALVPVVRVAVAQ